MPLGFFSISRNYLPENKTYVQFIPFDGAVDFHKLAAKISAVLAVIHVIGHVLNFRMIALQPKEVTACLIPSLVANDGELEKPTFIHYLFMSHQGFTGVILVLIIVIIHTFAHNRTRQKKHKMGFLIGKS